MHYRQNDKLQQAHKKEPSPTQSPLAARCYVFVMSCKLSLYRYIS